MSDIPAIVCDLGSSQTRLGFAGNGVPSTIFPSIVGYERFQQTLRPKGSQRLYYGDAAYDMRAVLALDYPIQQGQIWDWDGAEALLDYGFCNQLDIDPAERQVILTDSTTKPTTKDTSRGKTYEFLFERFQTTAATIASQYALGLLASGEKNGLVVSCSEGSSRVVPIYEGYLLSDRVVDMEMPGTNLNWYLGSLLEQRGIHSVTTTSAGRETLRRMKEKLCYVSQDIIHDFQKVSDCDPEVEQSYTLPDEQQITVGFERFCCPEVLFSPCTMLERSCPGIQDVTHTALLECYDHFMDCGGLDDACRSLFSNVQLLGGTTLLPGFDARFTRELSALAKSSAYPEINIVAPPAHDRLNAPWLGASLVADSVELQYISITKQDYSEYGASISQRSWM